MEEEKEKKKHRGIYQRGNIWWIKYYRNGKPYYESSKSDKITKAVRLLKKREGELEEIRVTDITTEKIERFIEKRKEDGLANSSINRELAALKRMFHLGARARKVDHIPYIPMLKESNTWKGFFDHREFLALREALPYYLKPVVTFAYHTGWRVGEILGFTWDKLDMTEKTVRLDPGETKSEEAWTISLDEERSKEMTILHAKRRPGCPYIFHREGQKIKRITRAWETACRKSGLWTFDEKKDRMAPTRIFHDFRRTAVRNMVRSGVPERVAMMISGHKTRSVFERYNIVSEADLKEAAKKQESYMLTRDGYNLVTIDQERAISGEGAIA